MRVLLALGNVNETGGWAAYARLLTRALGERGVAVTHVNYESWMLRLPLGIRHLVYFLRLLPKVGTVDVVLAVDTWSTGLPALYATRILHRPLVVRVGGDFLWEQYVERTGDLVRFSDFYPSRIPQLSFKERIIYRGTAYLLKRVELIVFNSVLQKSVWEREYPAQHVRIIENVFPERVAGVAPTKRNFVAAGRPIKLKQEALLREVFSELQQEYPDIELDMRPLPSAAHQERVQSCYAVVLSSVSDMAPNVIIDAVVYGKPFIAPLDTGLRERLDGTGLFVDTLDRRALKEAIIQLLDVDRYHRIAEAVEANTYVRTPHQVADEFAEALRSVTRH